MSDAWDILMFLGSSVCHQLPERSYFLDDLQMPICARCIGIHFGFLVAVLFLTLGPFRLRSGVPKLWQMLVLGAIMSIFFIDAGLSYSGISESTNLRRTISGLSIGLVLPFFIVPMMNLLALPGRDGRSVFEKPVAWAWLGMLFIVAATLILASQDFAPLFYAVSLLGVLAIFLTFSLLVSSIILLLFENRPTSVRTKIALGVTIAVSFLLAVATVREVLPLS